MDNEKKSRVQLMNDLFNEPSERSSSSERTSSSVRRTSSAGNASSASRTSSARNTSSAGTSSAPDGSGSATRRTSSARTHQVSPESSERTTRQASSASSERTTRQAGSANPERTTRQVTSVSPERTTRPRTTSDDSVRQTMQRNHVNRTSSSSASTRSSSNVRTTSPNRTYSDFVEEHKANKNSQAQPGKKKKKKKKKSNGFKKFLVIYAAVWLVIIIVGTIILSSFLTAYEAAQPTVTITEFVSDFSDSDNLSSFIQENSSKIIIPAGILDYESTIAEAVAGKTIAFIQNADYTPTSPSYNITSDGKTIAVVTLKNSGTGSFGLTKWEIGGIDITKCFGTAKTYSILVPENSTVYLNGVALDSTYVTGTGVPSDLENSLQYMSTVPEFTIYQVSTVTDDIEITGKDSTGADLVFSSNETSFVAGGKASDEFIASVNDRVEAALKEYATYFIYMSFNLSEYILEGSELYGYIFGSDTMDPINPWLYNWEYIDSYTFSVFDVSNYIKYSDDCFTVDVKYHLDMVFTDPSYKDDNQELDATWVWVKSGDKWYITDKIDH